MRWFRRRGKVLAVKWGYNPNSSSLGVDVTFLLFGMAAIAFFTPIISLFLRSGRVDGAAAGQQYAYQLEQPDGTRLTRQDPRARAVVSATGFSIVVDAAAFAWSAGWQPPAFADQIVYELHVGAFNPTTPGRPG